MTARRRASNGPPIAQTVLGVVLIGAAAYSSGAAYTAGRESEQRAECQANVNDQVFAALAARDTANRELSEAQRALIVSQRDGSTTPDVASNRYLAALIKLDKARADNPIRTAGKC